MNEQKIQRLHEYIGGIEQSGQFLGCIYTDAITGSFLEEIQMPAIDTREKHEGSVLHELVPHLKSGTSCALIISNELVGTIRNQLTLIAEGTFNTHLPGDEEPTVINPIHANTAIFLLPDNTSLEALHLQNVCLSACNLTT